MFQSKDDYLAAVEIFSSLKTGELREAVASVCDVITVDDPNSEIARKAEDVIRWSLKNYAHAVHRWLQESPNGMKSPNEVLEVTAEEMINLLSATLLFANASAKGQDVFSIIESRALIANEHPSN